MTATRFKPSRYGIINIWDYVNEVFDPVDGRLVLRGANGSGKTKALELCFPLLFDGRLDPRRLDPFSGAARTMKSNLLYRNKPSALGYAYMELSRNTPEGVERVSLGIGLRVKEGQTTPKSWFFVAPGRVGEEILLIDDDLRPCTRKELKGALGDDCVFDSAQRYREAINKQLFALEQDGYEAMVTLALTLRRPQLAKDLDPEGLKDILNQGLRPIDEDLMLDVALAFEDLDGVQRELSLLKRAHKAVTAYQTLYGTYLRSKAKERVVIWEGKANHAENIARSIKNKEERHAQLHRESQTLKREIDEKEQSLTAIRGQIHAMETSAAFKSVAILEALAQQVEESSKNSAQATRRRRELEDDKGGAATLLREVESALREAVAAWDGGLRELKRLAESAQLSLEDASLSPGDGDTLERHVKAACALRRQDVAAVSEALDAVESREGQVKEGQRTLARHEEEAEKARDTLESAKGALLQAGNALKGALHGWATASGEGIISQGILETLVAAIPTPEESASAPPSLAALLHGELAPLERTLATEVGTLKEQQAQRREGLRSLEAQRDHILAEKDDAPPKPPLRRHIRDNDSGAPLWRLVDFKEHVTQKERGAIEAALEISGLLDAWVDANGELNIQGDTLLTPRPHPQGPSLSTLLAPEPGGVVPAERIEAILESIPLASAAGEGAISMQRDGTFTLGPLRGHGERDTPIYIGASARARHRALRLEELNSAIEDAKGAIDALGDAITKKETQQANLIAAKEALPSDGSFQAAHQGLIEAKARLSQMNRLIDTHLAELERLTQALDHSKQALRAAARKHRAPQKRDALRALSKTIQDCEAAGRDLRHRKEMCQRSEQQVKERTDALSKLQARLEIQIEAEHEAKGRLTSAQAKHNTLRETQGASAEAILQRLDKAKGERVSLQAEQAPLKRRQRAAENDALRLSGELTTLRESLEAAQGDLAGAQRDLEVFQTPGIRRSLIQGTQRSEPEDGPFTPWLQALVAEVSGDASSIKSATSRATNQLQPLEQNLGSRFGLVYNFDDGLLELEIDGPSGRLPLSRFIEKISADVAEQQLLISDKERGLFEDQLLGALCSALHLQIQSAKALVQGMDEAMATRRMSSGQTIRLKWTLKKELDPTQTAALKHLNTEATHLGPSQLDTLRAYFSKAVKDARRDHPETPYLDLLQGVLDYRRWHAFALYLKSPGTPQRELTKRVYGTLSGGEKAVALHLPLFAAANAHFSGAAPHCPRIIALDEAFAGIDARGKPELLNLTVAFDLDLFLTGYDLWVSAEDVPGIAHYEIFRDALTGAISTESFHWYGASASEGEPQKGARP